MEVQNCEAAAATVPPGIASSGSVTSSISDSQGDHYKPPKVTSSERSSACKLSPETSKSCGIVLQNVCPEKLCDCVAVNGELTRCDVRRTLAPLSTRYFRVGTAARIRVSSLMFCASSMGTLRSARTSTRLPCKNRWRQFGMRRRCDQYSRRLKTNLKKTLVKYFSVY